MLNSGLKDIIKIITYFNAYTTLKKFYQEEGRIRLQSANSKMKLIYTKDPLIQRVAKGCFENFNQNIFIDKK